MSPPGASVGGPGHHPGTPASYNPSDQLPRQPSAAYSDATTAGSSRVHVIDHGGISGTVTGPKGALQRARRAAGRGKHADGVRPGSVVIFGSALDRTIAALRAAGFDVVVERGGRR
jgi:hypothetical protein